MKTKRILSVILALAMVISALAGLTVTASAEENNISWHYDEATKTLEISGEGKIVDAPWENEEFYCNDDVAKVKINEGVTAIMNCAFSCLSNLTEVSIPSSVKTIGSCAFSECESLSSVTLSTGLKTLGSFVFSECPSLTEIVIPESVTTIDCGVLSSCQGLESITIPSSVTEIQAIAFSGCENLSSVTLSEGLKTLGDSVFSECPSLTEIVIPESVTTIEWGAFSYCENLSSVTAPANISYVGDEAFKHTAWYDNTLENSSMVIIGSNLLEVKDCGGELVIPDGVTRIKGNVCNSQSITSVTIPSSVKEIGYGAFSECYNLSSVTFSEGLEILDSTAFYECPLLTEVVIPEGVTTINDQVFAYCESLTSVTLPEKIAYVNSSAFTNTPWYDNTLENESMVIIGGNLLEANDIAGECVIPTGVTKICEDSFCCSENITSVTIPEGVTTICDSAFSSCGKLTTINLPSTLTIIEDNAFPSVFYTDDNYNKMDNCIKDESNGDVSVSIKGVANGKTNDEVPFWRGQLLKAEVSGYKGNNTLLIQFTTNVWSVNNELTFMNDNMYDDDNDNGCSSQYLGTDICAAIYRDSSALEAIKCIVYEVTGENYGKGLNGMVKIAETTVSDLTSLKNDTDTEALAKELNQNDMMILKKGESKTVQELLAGANITHILHCLRHLSIKSVSGAVSIDGENVKANTVGKGTVSFSGNTYGCTYHGTTDDVNANKNIYVINGPTITPECDSIKIVDNDSVTGAGYSVSNTYTVIGQTENKTAGSVTINGLSPLTTYTVKQTVSYTEGGETVNGVYYYDVATLSGKCTPKFVNSKDSGYYADSATAETKEGIISFTALFENLDKFTFGANDKFGMFIYKTGNEENKMELDATDFESLKNKEGYFYSFVTDIAKASFDNTVVAKPYASINNEVYFGAAMEMKVNANKWLGNISNKPKEVK